jgi:hypothetical protein
MHFGFQVAVSQTASIVSSWRAVFLVRFQNVRLDAFTTFFYAFEVRDSGNMRQSQYGIPDRLTSDVSSGRYRASPKSRGIEITLKSATEARSAR